MPTHRARFRARKVGVEIRVREAAGTGIAKAYHTSSSEPVLINGQPLEMYGRSGQAALNRAIKALEREYGTMVEPKARKVVKRKGAKR